MGINQDQHQIAESPRPGLHTFSPTQQAVLTRDLLQLRETVGGTAGEIRSGHERLPVLRVDANVYVTTDRLPPTLEAAVNLDRADVHRIRNGADLQQFVERYRAFSVRDAQG